MRPVGLSEDKLLVLTRMATTALPVLDPLQSLANEGVIHATDV